MSFVEQDDAQTLETMKMFDRFSIGLPVFWGGEAYRVDARLRYRVREGKLTFAYSLIREDKVLEAATKTLIEKVDVEGTYPNETSMLFLADDTCLCLLRQDGKPSNGYLGTSRPPYTQWTWKQLDRKIGGPHMIRLADGRLLAAVRLYDKPVRTSLCWLDADKGTLSEALRLPSGGDTSYAGLVWHDGLLWVSYYSSHEGKTAIYLAKVKVQGG